MSRLNMMTLSSLMLLLAVSAEMYDMPTQDLSQKNNVFSIPVDLTEYPDVDAHWLRNIIPHRLLKHLLLKQAQQQESSTDTPISTIKESDEGWPEMSVKQPDVKKWFSTLATKAPARRKWKVNKGLCYFKLCSFKPVQFS